MQDSGEGPEERKLERQRVSACARNKSENTKEKKSEGAKEHRCERAEAEQGEERGTGGEVRGKRTPDIMLRY